MFDLRFPGQPYLSESGLFYNGRRTYDPQTDRYIESDPIGLQGGSYSTYAYAGGNPISSVDPLGLAQFGCRHLGPLPWLGELSRNPLDDFFHTDIAHEQLFFEDGLSPSNVGFFNDPSGGGLQSGEDISQYHLDPRHYDDSLLRQAVANVKTGKYKLLGNNCETYADKLRTEYDRLLKQLLQPIAVTQ